MEHLVEIFVDCNYPDVRKDTYIVGEYGTVINTKTNTVLKQSSDKDGYLKVSLACNRSDKYAKISVHRLVATAFHDNPNNYPVVDHKDGNKQNNHYSNLEWVTIRENTLRAESLGLRNVKGAHNGNNKYPERLVHEICRLFEQGYGAIDIYRKITGKNSVDKEDHNFYKFIIILRKRQGWNDITSQYNYTEESTMRKGYRNLPVIKENNKYSEDEIRFICDHYSKGKKPIDVLHMLKGDNTTARQCPKMYDLLSSIYRKERWKYIVDEYDF